MTTIVRLVLNTIVVYCGLVVVLNVVGLTLPAHTTRTCGITLAVPITDAFSVLSDIGAMPKWNRNACTVSNSSPLGDAETRLHTLGGNLVVTMVPTESDPPYRLVTALGTKTAPYS